MSLMHFSANCSFLGLASRLAECFVFFASKKVVATKNSATRSQDKWRFFQLYDSDDDMKRDCKHDNLVRWVVKRILVCKTTVSCWRLCLCVVCLSVHSFAGLCICLWVCISLTYTWRGANVFGDLSRNPFFVQSCLAVSAFLFRITKIGNDMRMNWE